MRLLVVIGGFITTTTLSGCFTSVQVRFGRLLLKPVWHSDHFRALALDFAPAAALRRSDRRVLKRFRLKSLLLEELVFHSVFKLSDS